MPNSPGFSSFADKLFSCENTATRMAAAGAASPVARVTSRQQLQDQGGLNNSVLSWKPGSDRILCYKNHGKILELKSSDLPNSSTRNGGLQRTKCFHLDFLSSETTAEQKSMHEGIYYNKQQGLHRESVGSPWYPVVRLLENLVHGVTSNSTIVDKAVTISGAYHDRYRKLMQEGCAGVEDAYWELVVADVREACDTFLPIYNESRGEDGYVSVEVAPYLARDGPQTLKATKWLHGRVNRPNLYIRIPSTEECLPAIKNAVSLGISVNSTLIFSLERYEEVAEAYLQGLESIDPAADLSCISGVACFFLSRVDAHVMQKLEELGVKDAVSNRGKAASAMAAGAFQLYGQKFSGPRWKALEKRGAKKQRLLWASTGDQNPAYPDTLYVVPLLRPDAVNTVSANPQEAFLKHVKAVRPEDCQCEEQWCRIYEQIQELGVCWSDVAQFLEHEGINSFHDCFENVLTGLVKADLENLFSQ